VVSEQEHEIWYGDANVANKMEKEQLKKNFYCGLKHLDLGETNAAGSRFKMKKAKIQVKPKYPSAIWFLAEAEAMSNL